MLINNAGIIEVGPMEVMTLDDYSEAVSSLKNVACGIETQRQQEASQFAAFKALPKQERKILKLLPVNDLMENDEPDLTIEWPRGASVSGAIHSGQSSLQTPKIHRGPQRVFVDENFIPFGASQSAIAKALGCDERSVRRHQTGIPRKQIAQTKPAYQFIADAIAHEQYCVAGDAETYISETADGLRLYEKTGASTATRPGGHPVRAEQFSDEYFGVRWLLRTNLYLLNYELTSNRAARLRFKILIEKTRRKAARGESSNIRKGYVPSPSALRLTSTGGGVM